MLERRMEKETWWRIWQSHLEEYLKSPPKAGFFICEYFRSIHNSLEIACGSSKDSIYLSKRGVFIVATDYEVRLIKYLKNRFSHSNLFYQVADAFKLPFKENTFNLVFHNGFFILFKDNNDIYTLLKEQERVSRKYILFFVHNKLNSKLVDNFSKLATYDPLYNIRFFEPKEVISIVKSSGIALRSVRILKFGGLFDFIFTICRMMPNLLYSFIIKIIPRLYQIQPWVKTERIACIIEVDK
jgi:hypothetical protein